MSKPVSQAGNQGQASIGGIDASRSPPAGTGKLIIISGPSGSGKSTVVARMLAACPLPLKLSVSVTTRPPRPKEVNGVHYWFVTEDEFRRRREANEFLECFEVFGRGVWYGTLFQPVSTGLKQGQWIILEIDVHGARQAVDKFPDAITIFVHPGTWDALEQRLRGRGSESEAQIKRRLEVAREEMDQASWYRHIVVNDQIEQAAERICGLLQSHK